MGGVQVFAASTAEDNSISALKSETLFIDARKMLFDIFTEPLY